MNQVTETIMYLSTPNAQNVPEHIYLKGLKRINDTHKNVLERNVDLWEKRSEWLSGSFRRMPGGDVAGGARYWPVVTSAGHNHAAD